ncbi:hypothetical protein FO519_008712 [Halicephalobus sp. NKZ332]|nr:hypothetical protein FO519_008712 [Halicephalobus sp. NKZ332]
MTGLDNFFAKKASKSKKNALSVGFLEKRLNHAMESQAVNKQEQGPNSDPNYVLFSEGDVPDSEWIDPDENASMNLAEIGIKDMAISGDSDKERSDDESDTLNEAPKTWKTELENKENDEEYPLPLPKPIVRAKYVPPTAARLRTQNVQLDLKNEEMFPSLDMAEQKEKEIKEALVKAPKQAPKNPNAYVPPRFRQGGSQPVLSNEEAVSKSESTVEKKNKYVPPALRR